MVDALTSHSRLAPGSRALIRLKSGFHAGPGATVRVEGKEARVLGVDETGVYFVVPVDLDEGEAKLTVTTGQVDSEPFPIRLYTLAPALSRPAVKTGAYCPLKRPEGTSLVAYGLGATNLRIAAGVVVPESPPVSTVLKPTVTVAGRQAEVVSSKLLPNQPNDGSYAIDVRLPTDLGPGRYPVVVSMEGLSSNAETLEVPHTFLRSAFTEAVEERLRRR